MATYSAYSNNIAESLPKVERKLVKGPVYTQPNEDAKDEGLEKHRLHIPGFCDMATPQTKSNP